jgi:hypothetical protein
MIAGSLIVSIVVGTIYYCTPTLLTYTYVHKIKHSIDSASVRFRIQHIYVVSFIMIPTQHHKFHLRNHKFQRSPPIIRTSCQRINNNNMCTYYFRGAPSAMVLPSSLVAHRLVSSSSSRISPPPSLNRAQGASHSYKESTPSCCSTKTAQTAELAIDMTKRERRK